MSDVTFSRTSTRICQWHWGAYASGDNDDVVLYEDDNSIWKLQQPWTDFSREPWFGTRSRCARKTYIASISAQGRVLSRYP